MAKFLNVNPDNLVLCLNATESINAALKSVDFNQNDAILATQYTYQAILNSIDYVAKYRLNKQDEIPIIKVPCVFPIQSKQALLDEFEKTCEFIINEKKKNIRLAVIDHISSATALLYPVKEIIEIVRKWSPNAVVLVDGAHAIGQVDTDINNLDCDFYVSNLHKWFFSPKSCSFLYFRDNENLSLKLQPNYISHCYTRGIPLNFYMRATTDQSTWYLVDDCVNYYENYIGGIVEISKHSSRVLEEAVGMLVKEWKTGILQIPKDLEAPFMKIIKLPIMKGYEIGSNDAEKISIQIMKEILEKFNVVCCVMIIQNELYCRISCFVYNSIEDYVALKDAVLKLVEA